MPYADGSPTPDEVAAQYYGPGARMSSAPVASYVAPAQVASYAPPSPPPQPPPAPSGPTPEQLEDERGRQINAYYGVAEIPPGQGLDFANPNTRAPMPPAPFTIPEVKVTGNMPGQGAEPGDIGPPAASPSPPGAAPASTAPVATKVAAGGGGGGGGGGYGKLQRDVADAQKGLLGTFDAMKTAKGQESAGEADKATMLGERHAEIARLQQEDAFSAQVQEQDAQKRFNDHLGEVQRQLDDVRSKKLDPTKLMKEHPALIATSIVGGALAGFYQGLTGGKSNQLLDDVDHMIDTQMKADEKNIDNEKSAITENLNLLQQQRAIYKDHQLAQLQTRNLYYEGLKSDIEAESARYDSPIITARGDQAIATIDQQQKTLQKQIADHALQVAQQQAAAAQSRADALRKERIDMEKFLIDKGIDAQNAESNRLKAENESAGKAGERTVVVDGKEQTAVSKKSAEDWNKYNHARTVFGGALAELKKAREAGDVGAYDSARATLIETYPELLGYSRAPTEGQIKVTVGPEAIPEYNHWYSGVNAVPIVGQAAYAVKQGRGDEKIKQLDKVLANSDKAMLQNTLGTKTPLPEGAKGTKGK